MVENLQIKFRKEKQGAEADLVKNFLCYYDNLFKEEGLQYTIFTELYAEVGIPDILIVAWDDNFKKNWAPERNKLEKTDIKILHHIFSSGKKGVKISKLIKQLGYKGRLIAQTLEKLTIANLIYTENETVKIKDFDDVFFVKKIISVEAKLKNWKTAFEQASLNKNFSSHSYVLLPNETISQNIIASANENIGILAHQGKGAIFKKKAKKSKLPGSYFSWILNEYVGRQFIKPQAT
jgi:hypothetical protein